MLLPGYTTLYKRSPYYYVLQDISPLDVFHFGGDEVPGNASLRSPACRKLGVNDSAVMKTMFVKRVSQIASKHKLQLQGWGDVFFVSDTQPLQPRTLKTSKVYTNAWMSRHPSLQRLHQLANAGYQVRRHVNEVQLSGIQGEGRVGIV